MKIISFNKFCKIIDTTPEKSIERIKECQDYQYMGEHLSDRIDHHLVFAAISCSPKFEINSIFEIGTCAGNCCRILSLMFPKAQIKTLDLPNSPSGADAIKLLKQLPNVTMEFYDSKLLPYREKSNNYDCVFVDGCHQNPEVSSDISWGCLHVNQVIVFHDVGPGAPDVIKTLLNLDSKISEEILVIDSESNSANIGVIILGHEKI